MQVSVRQAKQWLAELPRVLLIGGIAVVAVAFIVAIVMVATPNTDHGEVIARGYHKPWDQYIPSQCVVHDENGFCTYTRPAYYQHWDAKWDVRVQDEKGVQETLDVSETVFQDCTVGRWYPGNGEACIDRT